MFKLVGFTAGVALYAFVEPSTVGNQQVAARRMTGTGDRGMPTLPVDNRDAVAVQQHPQG